MGHLEFKLEKNPLARFIYYKNPISSRQSSTQYGPSARVATLKYTKNPAATPRLRTNKSARLTPRTSARLQSKILDNLVGGKFPRGRFVATLAKEFSVDRNFPAAIL
jgi:hypothetical protein